MLDRKIADPIDSMIAKGVIDLLDASKTNNTKLVVETLRFILEPNKATEHTKKLLCDSKSSLSLIYENPGFLGFIVIDEYQSQIQSYVKYILECYIKGLSPTTPIREEKQSYYASRHPMTIFVTHTTGHIFEIEAEVTDTIEKIKERVQPGLPPERMRLIFAGKGLADDRTLADYNIQKGNTVNMIFK